MTRAKEINLAYLEIASWQVSASGMDLDEVLYTLEENGTVIQAKTLKCQSLESDLDSRNWVLNMVWPVQYWV